MTPRDLVQRRRTFLERQETARDFILQLRPFIDALSSEPEVCRFLSALRQEAEAHREAVRQYDAEAVVRLIALGGEIRSGFPSPDPSDLDLIRPWHWASFDNRAKGAIELEEFALPSAQRDPTVTSRLLPFLRGKLESIVREVERSGDEAPLERSSPLWARHNDEQRRHEYAVRDLFVAEASHAGWCLRRITHVVGLLTRQPTSSAVDESGGLEGTPWEPVARAVNHAAFGTEPPQMGRIDVRRESDELVSVLRKDVDHLCEELELRLSLPVQITRISEPVHDPDATPEPVPERPAATAMEFDEATWDRITSLLPLDALLMTAVKVELRAVRSRLVPLPGVARVLRLTWDESTYYVGQIGRYKCAVVMSDAGSGGRAGAALTLHDAIARLAPSFVLSVGIAFGKTSESQNIADVLVSTIVIPYESERVHAEGDIARAPHPEAGIVLLNRLRTLDSEDTLPLKIHFGPLLSGEKLVDDAAFKATLLRKHPSAIGGEMEAAGIYAAAARNRLEWIVIKSICDWGDGTKTKQHQDTAAQNSSDVMSQLLSRGGLERTAFAPRVLSHRPPKSPPSEAASQFVA